MMRSLWTAASGMTAQQFKIDTISNNLANVNTTGFKKSRVDFQDLLYQTSYAGTPTIAVRKSPQASKSVTACVMWPPSGSFPKVHFNRRTTHGYRYRGRWVFPDPFARWGIRYTRMVPLRWTATDVSRHHGFPLEPEIIVPIDAIDFSVGSDGTVSVMRPGERAGDHRAN